MGLVCSNIGTKDGQWSDWQLALSLSNDAQRAVISWFWNLLDDRDVWHAGTRRDGAGQSYTMAKLDDALQRARALSTALGGLPNTGKGKTTDEIRRNTLEQDLARLRQVIFEYRQIIARLEKRPNWRHRKLCYIDDYGFVFCFAERLLFEPYVQGYWKNRTWIVERFAEAQAFEVLARLDDLIVRHGLDVRDNTFVGCSDQRWFSVTTYGATVSPSPDAAESPTESGLPSLAEMKILADACRSITHSSQPTLGGGIPGSGGGLGGSDSNWVQKTLARIDKRVNECVQGGHRGLEAGEPGWKVKGPLGGALKGLGLPSGVGWGTVLKALMDTPHQGKTRAEEERELAVQKALADKKMKDLKMTVQAFDQAASRAQAAADAADQAAAAAQQAAGAETDPQKKAKKEEDARKKREEANKKKKQAEKAAAEAECRRKSGMSCAEWDKTKKKKAQEDTNSSTEAQLEGVRYSSCETLKAQWEWFKSECERTGGWDRPGDKCNELLRRENGCVSTTLIMPTPDGDNTCRRGEITQAESIRAACKERQKVVSVAEHYDLRCDWLDRRPPQYDVLDVCSNPAARPRDDQACGAPGPGVTGTSSPRGGTPPPPYSNVRWEKGVQIFDSLGVDGLGADSH